MRDFTLRAYQHLLASIREAGYSYAAFLDSITHDLGRSIVLRHDVDKRPARSLEMARLESSMGARGTYYFRVHKNGFAVEVIKRIADLGHEIGYHYEEMATARGDAKRAFELFVENLAALRKIAPVSTICMHGSPMSKFDNKDLWKIADYRSLGVVGEPYLDVDFNRVGYFTDTGRRWDGFKVSVRDKVPGKPLPNIRTTFELADAVIEDRLPRQAMFTVHPQRWTDNLALWTLEVLAQGTKNEVKRRIVAKRESLQQFG